MPRATTRPRSTIRWLKVAEIASSRPGKRGLWWLSIALVLVCLVAPLAATLSVRLLLPDFFRSAGTDVSDLRVEQIEQFAALDLPESATDIRSNLSGFQDLFLRVRFALPASELPGFLTGTQFEEPLAAGAVPNLIAGEWERPWWQPDQARQFVVGETTFERPTGGRLYEHLLVDTTDPDTYIVYLVVFNT